MLQMQEMIDWRKEFEVIQSRLAKITAALNNPAALIDDRPPDQRCAEC